MKPVKAINHIGIAVRSIDAQRPFYEETLGAVYEGIEEVADQKVRVGFFRVGDVRLELLEPSDPSSTIAAFLDKKGEGLHHVAYTVEDLTSRIAELKQGGVRMIDESPRPARITPRLHSSIPRAHAACSPNCASLWRAMGQPRPESPARRSPIIGSRSLNPPLRALRITWSERSSPRPERRQPVLGRGSEMPHRVEPARAAPWCVIARRS